MVDYQSLDDGTVTVRERDTMTQDRVDASQLRTYLTERLSPELVEKATRASTGSA
jgi:glycyl-tRNA synthetase